jgi:cell division septation protein DedD
VVQLQALKNRAEAADLAGRLAAKGFPAFVLDPVPGEPVYYRVQVGGYADRPQADQVARQLEKDEHYKPYVRRR